MRYGSVCSGIEAATVAWHELGWQPVFFSEIEKFPSELLAQKYPNVPNHGDMTTFEEWGYEPGDIDVLVGGTPCQSFSVAGLRDGLADDRGNLALVFMRMVKQLQPHWVIWENVPGVLSSNGGRDFGSIVGALAELGYGWCYRVLDAQYFGVAQRRRRVFLVGCASGDWRDSAKILFESESSSGHFEASREEKQETPREIAKCLTARGGGGQNLDYETATLIPMTKTANCLQTTCNDYSRADGFNTVAYECHPADSRVKEMGEKCQTVTSRWGTGGGNVPSCLHGTQDPIVSEQAHPLQRNQGQENAVFTCAGVRRLTPIECERLQGFPDGYTDIKENTPDSPRYKALGNSMAVPVMRWIGQRIESED